MRLHEQVADLKKQITVLKRENTRLSKANVKLNQEVSKFGPASDLKDLTMQLEAATEHVRVLEDRHENQLSEISDMRHQIFNYQQLVAASAAVTVWKTQPDEFDGSD